MEKTSFKKKHGVSKTVQAIYMPHFKNAKYNHNALKIALIPRE